MNTFCEISSDQRGFERQEAYKFSVPLFGKNVVYDCEIGKRTEQVSSYLAEF